MRERIYRFFVQIPASWILIIIGIALFIPGIGDVHLFDWDEINFAESAREMLLTKNYRFVQINFEPFYEKPPLFIWLQALAMKIWGVSEWSARLPNALCGVVTLLVVYQVGKDVFSKQLGILWALFFIASILPHIYFKSGIIDPVFNLFIFSGVYFMYRLSQVNDFEDSKTRRRNRKINLLLSALFIGLATLTKGPVAILLAVTTSSVYFFVHRGKLKIELSEMILWWLIVALVVVSWLSFEIQANGIVFLKEFIRYQIRLFSTEDAGHGGPFYYHFIILLIGAFPASAFVFSAFRKNVADDFAQVSFKRWMIYLMVTVLVIFSVVKTKIIHYSSLCYFPITFLAAYQVDQLLKSRKKWSTWLTLTLAGVAITIVLLLTAGILAIQRPEMFINYIKDDFAKDCLKANVYWSNLDIIYGLLYLVSVIASIILIQRRERMLTGVFLLLFGSGIFINTLMIMVVPRVEKYSQAALIEFIQNKANENSRVTTLGFKSYAQYFYGRLQPPAVQDSQQEFFVTKVNKAKEVTESHPELEELYRKNGWVFYRKR